MILSVALNLLWAESTSDSLLPMKSLGNNHSNAKAQTHLVGPQPAPPLSPQESFSPCPIMHGSSSGRSGLLGVAQKNGWNLWDV